jgi:hypothetical protein
MSEQPDLPPPARPTPHEVWARATMWIVIVAMVVGAGVYVFRSCVEAPAKVIDKTGEALGKAGNALVTVMSAFNRGTITTSFLSYATSITPTHRLQFATLRQTEIFTRKDEASTAFGYVPLPEIVVEARAPVEYTYYLDLNARWQLVLQDEVLYVLAPEIRFNKPAVDASEIQFDVRKDSLLRDTKTAQENLKKSITSLAERRAKENVSLIRDTGRKQTAEFVEKWLAKSFTDGKGRPVKVYFPDETPPIQAPLVTPLPKEAR